nr:AIPR family protein [Adlercreutzia mucosicola]
MKSSKEPLCPDSHSAIITVRLRDFNRFATNDEGTLEKSLFEANIRDYQGSNAVNKAIRGTLQSDSEVDFWWLNNGITILADDVSRDMDNSITLTNPRIVNGLQTSNEIWNYCQNSVSEKDERRVLVKCIATGDQGVRAKIIQATNNQSTIPPAYLRSLETIHLQIEQYFKRHGLHYDRRKSTCRNEGIPAREIISVPFLGQCLIATLLQQPDYARARPAQILSDDTKYGKIFNQSISLDSYCALGRFCIHIRQFLKGTGIGRGAQNDLIFYVILVACAMQVGSFEIHPDDLKELKVCEDAQLQAVITQVNELYVAAGGDSKVAKSSDFALAVMEHFDARLK